jgi:hypothetical protein
LTQNYSTMNLKHSLFFLSTALLVFASSCKKDNPPNDSNVVEVTKNIDQVTTWSKDSIYLIKKYDFYVNNSLTIEAGTIVKFHSSDGPDLTLGNSGTIIAVGTSSDPIIFTSYKDDAHGGDTNGDEDATSPARKDWGRISTNGLNGSRFEYCTFMYGGAGSYTTTLSITSGSKATVRNCTFTHNDGSDGTGWYGALDASDAISGTVIENNTFYDNVRPLSISTAFSLDASNVFHNPNDPTQTNTYNGIMVESINEVTSAISWAETEVPFVIDDNDFWIESGGSLSLANNVVLKFRPGSVLLLESGTSGMPGYTNAIFTSYKDDSRLGDTNGDAAATSPANGDWEGIYDDSMTIPSPYYYTWTNIYYDNH